MDILYTVENANLRGGTEILTFNLMHALRAEGRDCKILSIIPYTGEDENVLSLTQEEYDSWNMLACSIKNKLTFCKQSDEVLKGILRKKIAELQPRILVNQTYDLITALPTELNVAQVFNWSVCGYEESVRKNIAKKGLVGRLISSYVNAGITKRRHQYLSQVPRLITLSHAAADELRSLNANVQDRQITMIPDPLAVSEDSIHISSLNNKNVVFVGRLSHEKGVMRLLRIWQKVCNHLEGYTLSIYGTGDAKSEMQAFLDQKSIPYTDHSKPLNTTQNQSEPKVIFMGFCNDLEQIYLNTDLLLMTSDTEGFGMVLIESMYYGVPCISFDCPISPKEIIADAGVTVPCFDEDAYTKEVVRLLCHPDRMKDLQQKSIQRARDYYMDKIVKEWIKL